MIENRKHGAVCFCFLYKYTRYYVTFSISLSALLRQVRKNKSGLVLVVFLYFGLRYDAEDEIIDAGMSGCF